MTRIILLLTSLLIAYAGFALYSLQQIQVAIGQSDAELLSDHIDFPAVRASLKDQFAALLLAETVKKDKENNEFSEIATGLGAVFGAAIVEKLVDSLVTPAALSALLSRRSNTGKTGYVASNLKKIIEHLSVVSPTHLLLSEEGISLSIKFEDWTWKITSLHLPADFVKNKIARQSSPLHEEPPADVEPNKIAPIGPGHKEDTKQPSSNSPDCAASPSHEECVGQASKSERVLAPLSNQFAREAEVKPVPTGETSAAIAGGEAATIESCFGTFSDMSNDNASGDSSGITVSVRPPNRVSVKVYEGDVSVAKARNVKIDGNTISFDYFKNHLRGTCSSAGIIGPGFNNDTGKKENRHLLKRITTPASAAQPPVMIGPQASGRTYCAMVGNDDTVRPLMRDLIPYATGAFGGTEDELYTSTVFRCMNGRAMLCNYGANLICDAKADQRRDFKEVRDYCRQNPGAELIPMAVTGHATIHSWKCAGTKPVITDSQPVDERGFNKNIWWMGP